MDEKWNAQNDLLFEKKLSPVELLELQMERSMEFFWIYRFIHREFVMLLKNDEQLKKFYDNIHNKRINAINNLIKHFVSVGYFKDLDEKTIDLLSHTIWLVVLFWQPYLEVGGEDISKNKR